MQHLQTANEARPGLTQRELLAWFLHDHAPQVESEADLVKESKKVRAVIGRLVDKEHVLLVADDPQRLAVAPVDSRPDERFLIVHPNYTVDK